MTRGLQLPRPVCGVPREVGWERGGQAGRLSMEPRGRGRCRQTAPPGPALAWTCAEAPGELLVGRGSRYRSSRKPTRSDLGSRRHVRIRCFLQDATSDENPHPGATERQTLMGLGHGSVLSSVQTTLATGWDETGRGSPSPRAERQRVWTRLSHEALSNRPGSSPALRPQQAAETSLP